MADDTTLDSISEKLALWREAVQFDLPEDLKELTEERMSKSE